MIGSISDQSAFKARSPELCKVISISVHHDDLRSFAQIEISVSGRRKGLSFDRTHDQRTNAYKSGRGSRLTSLTISYNSHHHVQKARSSRSMLHTASITFSTRNTVYKKQGAPDRRSIQLLLLSAHTSSRTKSKELHRYVLQT
jgi:hypothetical protein